MKKILIVISLMAFLAACKKTGQNGLDSEGTTLNTKIPIPTTKSDPVWNVLGYGYDVTGEYARANSSRAKVLNIQALDADYPSAVESDESGFQNGVIVAGGNAVDFSKNLTFKVGIDTANNKLFKGSIESSFSNSISSSSKYIYAFWDYKIQQRRMFVAYPTSGLQNYLDPTFAYMVQNESPAYIINTYGTHVLGDILLGGVLEVMYQSQTNASERKNAASAGINISIANVFNLNAGGTTSSSYASTNSSAQLHYKMAGGEPATRVNGLVSVDPSSTVIPVDAGPWINSCTPANSDLIDFGPTVNNLIPIYELIADPVKRAAVESYMTQYLSDRGVKLTPDPIYQFYTPVGDHFTSINPNATQGYSNWESHGIDFKAYASQVPGTLPVYQFYNGPASDHFISINPNAVTGLNNWQNYGIEFYAYPTQVAGTIPIYEYWYGAGSDHFVTANPNITQYAGWVSHGVVFYAFPN